MVYYLFVSLFLFLNTILKEVIGFKKGKNAIIFLIIFILAFNYQMGVDWINYQEFYECVVPCLSFFDVFTKDVFFEKGYVLINFIFYNLGFNYELYMGTILSICIYILLNFIYKKSENYYLSFFIFIVFYLFSNSLEPVIRQLIAITLITYAFEYIEKRKFFHYLIFVIIAFFFHESAIVGIFIYIISLIEINLKRLVFIIFFCYISILNLHFILENLSKIILPLSRFIGYFNEIKSMKKSLLLNIYFLITSFAYMYIVIYCYKYSDKKNNLYKNLAIIFLIIRYFQDIFPLIYRINQYFILSFSICMGSFNLITFNKKIIFFNKKYLNILFAIILYIPFILNMYKVYSSELNKFRYFNYKNYFIEMINKNLFKNFNEKADKYEKEIKKIMRK